MRRSSYGVHLEEFCKLLAAMTETCEEGRRRDIVGLAFTNKRIVLEEILFLSFIDFLSLIRRKNALCLFPNGSVSFAL
jgi:hypothetical protein